MDRHHSSHRPEQAQERLGELQIRDAKTRYPGMTIDRSQEARLFIS
jgi:hypothetical protein